MFRCLIALVVGCLMSGCAALVPASSLISPSLLGPASPQVHDQTSVNLEQANFVLVKTNVLGESKGFSLLGLISICPASLTEAMSRMYASANMRLGEPQTMAHLVVEQRTSYWILFGIPRVEVHADVIQFRPASSAAENANRPRGPAKLLN